MSVEDPSEPGRNIPLPYIISDAPEFDAPDFGFEAYARSMADVIRNPKNKTPLVIGLYGAWGTGKTTLMRRVEQDVKAPKVAGTYRPCKTVWFEAWKHAEEDALLAALIEEIFKAMEADGVISWTKAQMEKIAEELNLKGLFDDAVKALSGGLINPENWFSSLEHKEKLGFYPVFNQFFDRLLWSYVTPTGLQGSEAFDDEKGSLVIFIDDLDRCPYDRIVKVLETIKLFMDKSGCVFVIGADRAVIEAALERRYGVEAAKKFMEKIVQVTFTLPPVPPPETRRVFE